MTKPLILCSLFLLCHSSFSEDALTGSWRFSHGPEFPGAQGALDANVEPMALQYDFTDGGNYVAAYCDLEAPLRLSKVRFRLLKPEETTVTVRVTDRSGQTFQKSLFYDGMGYRDIAVNMYGWDASWGGPGDGILRQPIRTFGILLERQGLSVPEGSIMFTGVRYEESSEMESEEAAIVMTESLRSYLVSEFDADCVLARSAGDALKAGKWDIDFSVGGRAALGGSLSLFHKPITLTLRAKASAPGAALVFHIGSHFQTFERTVGVFDGTDQTFTFTLPPDGWEASGAAHETLHDPLRITAIAIERHECIADQLQIALGDLACETQVPPGAAITLTSELLF